MNFPQLKFIGRIFEVNPRLLCWATVLGIALLANGCITATELLYSDPAFSTTLKEFDKLHAQDKLPGLPSDQKPRSLQAYYMSEDYMRRNYYRTWREASHGCRDAQVVVANKPDRSACAYFFCTDSGRSVLQNTLHQKERRAPWTITP